MEPNNYKLKTALVSVSDKTGIDEFCRELVNLGFTVFSTGGTMKHLASLGIPVKSVEEITNFPEILSGRVKTLHPALHGGLLADLSNPEHASQMIEHNLMSIDLLVVNLYPFEQTLAKQDATHEELIENIDIGGPGMLRAAAKNYRWTVPVINPNRYNEILDELKVREGAISLNTRSKLAGEVFAFTSYYDALISNYFNSYNHIEIPEKIIIPASMDLPLRYGENPHQQAALMGNFDKYFSKLHGKELSYNNILDISNAVNLILEFEELALAIIKHTNPCGVATGETLTEAWEKAFATDNVSPFGGIICANRKIDAATAETLHGIFTELIIAPGFTKEALEILTKKKDRRLIEAHYGLIAEYRAYEIKSVIGGFLMQESDKELTDDSKLRVVTKREPTEAEMQAMKFGWKIAKHVKSNAIVFASRDRTLGIGAGQMSRVDSARIATDKARLMGLNLQGSIVASDAFFPFPDGVEQAAEAGATAVIQPGGSVRDEDVIKTADELGMAMIFTGMRHFKH